jgi:GABA permease
VLIIMVMRMLGEMAAADPATGSFADYARKSLGGWAGFSVGWLYWYFWVIVVGFEAVAGAGILQRWVPLPLWLLSLILMVLMTATNLYSVRSYGEFEYWFAGVEVVTIVFIVLGTLFVLGLWPGKGHGLLQPHRARWVVPERGRRPVLRHRGRDLFDGRRRDRHDCGSRIRRAREGRLSGPRTRWCCGSLFFFVGSIFLLATILPWNSAELGESPYVSAFEAMNIGFAAEVMNFVVLTAVLSCLNSGLYTASRMLFVLAARNEAPERLLKLNRKGVPAWAILSSSVVGFLCVIAAAISPDRVFLFLLNSSGAIILFVYLLICLSQLRMRRMVPPEKLIVKMWL